MTEWFRRPNGSSVCVFGGISHNSLVWTLTPQLATTVAAISSCMTVSPPQDALFHQSMDPLVGKATEAIPLFHGQHFHVLCHVPKSLTMADC